MDTRGSAILCEEPTTQCISQESFFLTGHGEGLHEYSKTVLGYQDVLVASGALGKGPNNVNGHPLKEKSHMEVLQGGFLRVRVDLCLGKEQPDFHLHP